MYTSLLPRQQIGSAKGRAGQDFVHQHINIYVICAKFIAYFLWVSLFLQLISLSIFAECINCIHPRMT